MSLGVSPGEVVQFALGVEGDERKSEFTWLIKEGARQLDVLPAPVPPITSACLISSTSKRFPSGPTPPTTSPGEALSASHMPNSRFRAMGRDSRRLDPYDLFGDGFSPSHAPLWKAR